MIDSLHHHYFEYPDGKTSPSFVMKTSDYPKPIVMHPYFHFDFEKWATYQEKYKIIEPVDEFIAEFITLSETNSGLREEEILWYDTEYWTIKCNALTYIGSGIRSFDETRSTVPDGMVAFLLDSHDFVVLITSRISKGVLRGPMFADIYCSNVARPFVEILDPFRKAIRQASSSYSVEIERQCSIEMLLDNKTAENMVLVPHAITPMKNLWIGPVVISNNFSNQIEYLYAHAHGGWLKNDFLTPVDCYLVTHTYKFDEAEVIEVGIRPRGQQPSGERIIDDSLKRFKKFLDRYKE